MENGSKFAKVVNVKNKEPYDVFIGRPSKWGNPFRIGKDGTRMGVIRKYEEYIRSNKKLMKDIEELKGKILGCFCAPKPCHGDILLKLIREMESDKKIKTLFAEEK